jgi:hypothetical protein
VSRKGKDLYYLFPGQGRGARKRFVRNLFIGFVVGSLAAGMIAWLIYTMEK